jgi:hypothetical protein
MEPVPVHVEKSVEPGPLGHDYHHPQKSEPQELFAPPAELPLQAHGR